MVRNSDGNQCWQCHPVMVGIAPNTGGRRFLQTRKHGEHRDRRRLANLTARAMRSRGPTHRDPATQRKTGRKEAVVLPRELITRRSSRLPLNEEPSLAD